MQALFLLSTSFVFLSFFVIHLYLVVISVILNSKHALNRGAEISQLSLNISVHSAHFPCRNERTSIYEIRRKSLCFRGVPPNSLSFKFRRLSFNSSLRGYQQRLNISILRQVREIFGKHFKHILRILHAYIMSKKVPYNPKMLSTM